MCKRLHVCVCGGVRVKFMVQTQANRPCPPFCWFLLFSMLFSTFYIDAVVWARDTHLPVDEAHDGGLHPHAHGEAGVHVLVVEERLQAGQQEDERGVEVALPERGLVVLHEAQQQAADGGEKSQAGGSELWMMMLLYDSLFFEMFGIRICSCSDPTL